MQWFYIVVFLFVAAKVGSLSTSLRALTAHNLRFPLPDAKTVEPGQLVFMEPFMTVVRVLEVEERPTGMLAFKIEKFEGEQVFASDAL